MRRSRSNYVETLCVINIMMNGFVPLIKSHVATHSNGDSNPNTTNQGCDGDSCFQGARPRREFRQGGPTKYEKFKRIPGIEYGRSLGVYTCVHCLTIACLCEKRPRFVEET